MAVLMVVRMTVIDPAWIAPYFATVPKLLAEYGARPVAGSRAIARIEGEGAFPDRVAIFSFPDMVSVEGFMADERYQPFKAARQKGSTAEILVFENAAVEGGMC